MPPRQEKRVTEIQGNAERGSKLFKSLCNGCHTSALRGIFGKNIASGNMQYTSGLAAKATEKWTFKNLDLFLAHPKTFAPETAINTLFEINEWGLLQLRMLEIAETSLNILKLELQVKSKTN